MKSKTNLANKSLRWGVESVGFPELTFGCQFESVTWSVDHRNCYILKSEMVH